VPRVLRPGFSLVANKGAGSAAVACAGCSTVDLNYNQFGGSSIPENEAISMHEALHNLTGLSDYQIQSTLSAFGLKTGVDSSNITNLLEQKCVF
jgi:hypothetical protein